MRRSIFSLISCLLVTILYANPVTLEQARQTAADFLASQSKGGRRAPAQIVSQQTVLNAVDASGNPYLYAFNTGGNAGYVIVSGDDRFREVLGYSASGNLDNDNMPAHIKAWLQGYVDEMKYYESIGYQPSASTSNTTHRAVKAPIIPLLTTAWDQGDPYNNMCPVYVDGKLSVTGCVATAMAQVVCYTARHSSKELTTLKKDIPGYTISTKSGNMQVKGISADTVSFDWTNMRDTYYWYESYSIDQAYAVAKLMACCGKSVQMDYSSSESGAYTPDVAKALVDYFDFDTTTKSIVRDDYSYAQWIDLMYAELAAGRPVQYGGQSSGGGHSFVIDGYDGDELFHVNWGWSGEPDSYYALSVLNPHSTSGIGASSSNDGFSFDQKAIIGIQYGTNQTAEEEPIMVTTSNFRVNGQQVIFSAFNNTGATHSFSIGIGFMDEEGGITPINGQISNCSNLPNNHGWYDFDASVPTNKANAGKTLKVVPISHEQGATQWYTGCNSDIHYFEAVYNANGVPTLTAHPIISLQVADISFSGSLYMNEVQPVDITVTNNADEYYGVLYLFASKTQTKGKAVNKGGITVQKNKTASLTFEWTPTATGTYYIWVATDENGNNVIGTSSVNIGTNQNAPAGPFVYSELIAENADETSWRTDEDGHLIVDVYSKELNFSSVKVLNATSSSQSTTQLLFYLYKEVNGDWQLEDGYSASNISVNGGFVINFGAMPFYEVGYGRYLLKLETNNKVYDERYIFNLTMGYNTIDENGNVVLVKTINSEVTVDEDVTAVDLSGFDFTSITPNNNPNTLYVIGNKQVPESLTGKNVVQNGTATQITLTDGYAFYSPVDFMAENISYTRTEKSYYDKTNKTGWTTLVLPFAATGIKTFVGDKKYDLEWFHNASDTNKNLWLMEFSDEVNNVAEFGYVTNLEANKPYIMALPGDSYGNKWSLEGLPIIFYATNADIKGNAKAATTGTNYKFKGTTVFTGEQTNIYKLNEDGNKFVKGTGTASVAPFRAYFEPTTTAALATSLAIGFVGGGNATAIQTIDDSIPSGINGAAEWFTLDGRRLNEKPTAKGIYILNGKKVVVK